MLTEKQKKSFGNSIHSLYSMYISSAIVGVCVCVCVCDCEREYVTRGLHK